MRVYGKTETIHIKSTQEKPVLKAEESGAELYLVDTKESFVWHVDTWMPKLIGGSDGYNLLKTLTLADMTFSQELESVLIPSIAGKSIVLESIYYACAVNFLSGKTIIFKLGDLSIAYLLINNEFLDTGTLHVKGEPEQPLMIKLDGFSSQSDFNYLNVQILYREV